MDEQELDIICPLLWKMSEACHDKCHSSPLSEAGASAASHTQTGGVYYQDSKAGFSPNPHLWEKKCPCIPLWQKQKPRSMTGSF